jgi:copper(I)-binding protein
MNVRRTILRRVIGFLLVATTIAACGGGGGISVEDAWARTSAGVPNAGAAYMTISGGDSSDRLIGISVPANVAGMAQLHRTTISDDGNNTMSMEHIPSLDIAAGAEIKLEPGGYHVMMMNLAAPLTAGMEFVVTLKFENAGDVGVSVSVRDEE